MARHPFGGPWTQLKLSILRDYLNFFTKALKGKGFTLHYADAFAGTGHQSLKATKGQDPMFPIEDLDGSAQIALNIEPPFHKYHLNDLSNEHYNALNELVSKYPTRDCRVTRLDGNEFVKQFCQSLSSNDRAIVFIDPYSTELHWDTLKHVANSQRIDLWLLFPISALLRMTPNDPDRLDESWVRKIDLLLGTSEWKEALYKPKPTPIISDMFGEIEAPGMERLNVEEVAQFVRSRLGEEFAYVAKPATLYAKGTPLFLFMFAVSNRVRVAQALAERVSTHILRKYQRRR
ncbi:three-Cys-motif partner protein TcmP [Marinobacter sp.]|uniref:three-Cys-motif partner protein TcmP n=1 Tax=Marinobacter sp. TaxID=50741 RepID=UPI003B51D20C